MTPNFFKSIAAYALLISTFAGFTASAEYYTCYEQEYRCETRYEQDCDDVYECRTVPGSPTCRQERVCETRYENECRNENQCYTVPGTPSCSQERVCKTRNTPGQCQNVEECGTNALGQPICKTRQVCDGGGSVEECGYVERCSGGGSRQECSTRQVCDNRPVQECGYVERCDGGGSRQECSTRRVCSNTPREVCGNVTVPKQCYRPDPIDVYPPPPPPIDVDPIDPPPPPPPPIDVDPIDPPPVDPINPEIGAESVKVLKVTTKSGKSILTFEDRGQSVTYRTRYFISIYSQKGELVLNQFSSEKGKMQKITLNQTLSVKEKYQLTMKVQRSGGELIQDVNFSKVIRF